MSDPEKGLQKKDTPEKISRKSHTEKSNKRLSEKTFKLLQKSKTEKILRRNSNVQTTVTLSLTLNMTCESEQFLANQREAPFQVLTCIYC